MSAIWTGNAVYLFGGMTSSESFEGAYSDDILEYTLLGPSTVLAKLPHATGSSSTIWDGKNAYIFGGFYVNGSNQTQYSDNILVYGIFLGIFGLLTILGSFLVLKKRIRIIGAVLVLVFGVISNIQETITILVLPILSFLYAMYATK